VVFSHKVENKIIFVHIQGDLLGLESDVQLLNLIDEKIKNGVSYAVIDISEVDYMNSSGLNTLIKALNKMRTRGGELVLVNPSEKTQKLLVITKLNAIFKTVDDQQSAIDFVNNRDLSAK